MKNRFLLLLCVAALGFSAAIAPRARAADAVELRFTWYNDGQEGQALRTLLDQFEKENTDIKVTLDVVAFKDLHTTLSAQAEVDKAPDLARETEPQRYYGKLLDLTPNLKDPKAITDNYAAALLGVLAGPQKGAITGYPLDFSSSGPFVNVALFKKAGVEIPSDKNEKVTWDQWIAAAKQVRDKTGVPYAIAYDCSGHRWFSTVLQFGGKFFDANGKFTIDTPQFRKAAEMLIGWHKDGLAPLEVWGGSCDPNGALGFFVAGQVPFYYGGSFRVSNFDKAIADKFEWKAVPNPCVETCTGMPGGGFVIAFKNTQHPKEVARLVEFLTSKKAAAEFAVKSPLLPARLDLAKEGLEYPARSADLKVFLGAVGKTTDEAFNLQNNPLIGAVNVESRDRLRQVIVGEISLDDAIKKIQAKMDELQAPKK
jgi:alpha-1,4-digalacturonate transport system substrate-binding protein